jgi:hypothetical protein
MKRQYLTKALLGVVAAGAASFLSTANAAEMKSIADSWHNLGSLNSKTNSASNKTGANHSTDTAEICVFCHTPHGGDNTAAVPIWNRKLNAPANYKRYGSLGSSTFDATEVDIGSVTIACLSCHDGGQAIDSLINAPGSGGFTDRTAYVYGGMPRLGTMVGADLVGSTGTLDPGVVQNLGTDLSNDHPVSMQYAGGGIKGAQGAWSGTSVDPDFTGSTQHPPQLAPSGSISVTFSSSLAPQSAPFTTLFWLERSDSQNTAGRDREDIIFYTRSDLGSEEPFVECGSCHDPHNVANPTFLRTSNGVPSTLALDFPSAAQDAASGLCLTCHIK